MWMPLFSSRNVAINVSILVSSNLFFRFNSFISIRGLFLYSIILSRSGQSSLFWATDAPGYYCIMRVCLMWANRVAQRINFNIFLRFFIRTQHWFFPKRTTRTYTKATSTIAVSPILLHNDSFFKSKSNHSRGELTAAFLTCR